MSSPAADTLLRQLRLLAELTGRLRLERPALWSAFLAADPEGASRADARPALVGLLQELAAAGELQLPRSRRSFATTAAPPFPEWLTLARPPAPPAPGEPLRPHDPKTVPWAPELAFASAMGRLGDETWSDLHALQRFFQQGGRRRPFVPARERSVRIFGDEKQLDRVARSPLFGIGRLSYEVLRCFPVVPPLVWDPGPGLDAGPILVLESHHTFYSFCSWNRTRGRYAAIVYGGGASFGQSVEYLLDVTGKVHASGELLYFGDLDPEGLRTASRAAEAAARLSLPPLRPAVDWYARLLTLGRELEAPILAEAGAGQVDARALNWLPEGLRPEVAELLASGRRLPQELLGWEVLDGC